MSNVENLIGARVLDVLPRIREAAARTEAERRIPTEVLATLLDTGVFDLTRDTATEAGLLDIVRVVAGACGSTGWVTANSSAVPWLVRLFPAEALQQLRDDHDVDVDPLVGFSVEPGGTVVEDADGLVLTGHWPTVTGAAQASWLVLAARRHDVDDAPGRIGLVLVSVADCRLEHSVDSVGLTAAGAEDVRVSGVRLPAHGWAEIGATAPALAPVGAAVAMAVVGAAQGALDGHLHQTRQRVALSHGGEEVSARDLSPARIARAASLLDAAVLMLDPAPDCDDDYAHSPFLDQLYAVDRAAEAAELVFGSVRGHALDNDDPVARLWRDVRVGAQRARSLICGLRLLGA